MEVWDIKVPSPQARTKFKAFDGGPHYYDELYVDDFAERYEEALNREYVGHIFKDLLFGRIES